MAERNGCSGKVRCGQKKIWKCKTFQSIVFNLKKKRKKLAVTF